LITPDKYNELLADLKQKTGLPIERIEIGHIDFLKDAAYIKLFYKSETIETNSVDGTIGLSRAEKTMF